MIFRPRRGDRDLPLPKHPYRDTALLNGVLAVLFARDRLGDRRRRRSTRSASRLCSSSSRPAGAGGGSAADRREEADCRSAAGMSATGTLDATVEALCGDLSRIRAPRGTELNAGSWQTEAPLRMLLNNLDAEVAEHPEELVVYGGSGRPHGRTRRCARSSERSRALATTRRCSSRAASRSACSARTRARRGC